MKKLQFLFIFAFLQVFICVNAYNYTIINGTKVLPSQPTDPAEKEKYCANQTPNTYSDEARERCLKFGGVVKTRHEYCFDTYYCEYPVKTTTTTTTPPIFRTIPVFTLSSKVTLSTKTLSTTTARIIATRPLPIYSSVTTSLTKAIPTTTTTKTITTKTIPTSTTTTKTITTKTIPTSTTTTTTKTITTKTIPTSTTTTKTITTKTIPTSTTTTTKTITTKTIPTSTTTTTKTIPTLNGECPPVTVIVTEKVKVTVTEKVTVTVQSSSNPTSQPQENCVKKWAQCGGQGYSGPTCCEQGSTCHEYNSYYSQCI